MIKAVMRLLGTRVSVVALIVRKGRVLLTKRSTILEGGKWCLPGGAIKFGESPEEAVRRELREETGLETTRADFLFYHTERVPRLGLHSLVFVFLVSVNGKPKPNWEVSALRWFSSEEIATTRLAFTHNEIITRFLRRKR